MKSLLLAQAESQSTINIIKAFQESGADLSVVYYYLGGKQSAWIKNDKIETDKDVFDPGDYDCALLRSWGTAALGATFLELCENHGLKILHPSKNSRITNSKVESARLFMGAQIPFPTTVFGNSAYLKQTFDEARSLIPEGKLVFKPDYGTHGNGIAFIDSLNDLLHIDPKSPFILQEFIGNPDQPISHYRVIVAGGEAHEEMLHLTAIEPLRPSNWHAGSVSQRLPLNETIGELAVNATHISGLAFSGVDIMDRGDGRYAVLEVNDAPAVNINGEDLAVARKLVRTLTNS